MTDQPPVGSAGTGHAPDDLIGMLQAADWAAVARLVQATGMHRDAHELDNLRTLAEVYVPPAQRDNFQRRIAELGRRTAAKIELLQAGDWPAMARLVQTTGMHQDADELRDLWALAAIHVPPAHRESFQRRIAALGRAAAKTAARLAVGNGQTEPVKVEAGQDARRSAPVPTVVEPAAEPSPTSPRRRPQPERRFTLDTAAESTDFAAAVREELTLGQRPDVSDQRLAEALAAWHDTVTVQGEPLRFVSWPGWTGVCLAMWLSGRYPQMGRPEPVEPESRVWTLSRSTRKLLTLGWLDRAVPLSPGRLLCEMDINAQFLAAARSTLLGDGEPVELDADEVAGWDQLELVKLPGYVVLASPPDPSGMPGHVAGAFAQVTTGRKKILPNPLALYLVRDRKVRLDIAEAVVWHTRTVANPRTGKPETVSAFGKRLAKWAEVMADGRAALIRSGDGHDRDHPALLALMVLKRTYSQFIGSMLRSTKHNRGKDGGPTGWLRPDWYDMVIATATANLLRSVDKAAAAGWQVLGGLKDSVWLVADGVDLPPDPDIPAAPVRLVDERPERWERLSGMQVDRIQPGRWKLTRHAVIDDRLLTTIAKGRPQPFREALGEADRARRAA